ncbi:MAG: ATP-binding protein [Lachnospiraceae bacterium]|nr:ATP-binding protein [Lachnospiraceae bacterium]
MARTVGIGHQDFEQVIKKNLFYVDKTAFIKEWWEKEDVVTLITRPRRFGKTLNMSMLEKFFSVDHAGRGDLFEGLSIWREKSPGGGNLSNGAMLADENYKFRMIQGTWPVISLSFANVKETTYQNAVLRISQILTDLYHKNAFLLQGSFLSEAEKKEYHKVSMDMPEITASMAIHKMSEYLFRYYGKKVIILLDEYDAPMQEAYVNGYWQEIVSFTRSLFNAAFKTNPYLERAIMTGITRISKESVFSDLNNLKVVTTTSDDYASAFGFTEEEVFKALDEYGMGNCREEVKQWYDGFTFGKIRDIYNPWSIINLIDDRKFTAYWANTSSNSLVGKLIREGSRDIKVVMEDLLKGKKFCTQIDEQIVFDQLPHNESAVWSLLLASGYLKVENCVLEDGKATYELSLTNREVSLMFQQMIEDWFAHFTPSYNDFVKALLLGDIRAMNTYMNRVALSTFSYFDTGSRPSEYAEPERFYHGFVLGLTVDLAGQYSITSNRESGFGRYDVVLEPCGEMAGEAVSHDQDTAAAGSRNRDAIINNCNRDAIIMEFKVHDPYAEETLQDTVDAALDQIEKKQYSAVLEAKGFASDKIRKYGFAFQGKKVLIGEKRV